MCERCGTKPQGYHDRRWCYDCKPGSNGRPLPCRRCGSSTEYWAEQLCRRCHQYAPQTPESCRDCLAWGVRRTDKWLCGGCISWRFLHPGVKTCIGCGEQRCVNDHRACRLCWAQAKLIRAHVGRGRRASLDVAAANRHGQQLFLANLASSKNGYRPRLRQPETPAAVVRKQRPRPSRRKAQLDLFTRDPIRDAARSYGFPDPPSQPIANTLDEIARDHATRHGWAAHKTHAVRTAIRVLLGMCHIAQLPIRASDVSQLHAVGLRVRPVLEVIAEAGLLEDDRTATIDAWFAARVHDLPQAMTGELQIWFDVLRHGSHTPPRSRPRVPGTITTRLT